MHWAEWCPKCDEHKGMSFGNLEYEADGYITRTWKCGLCESEGIDRYSLVEREEHTDEECIVI